MKLWFTADTAMDALAERLHCLKEMAATPDNSDSPDRIAAMAREAAEVMDAYRSHNGGVNLR